MHKRFVEFIGEIRDGTNIILFIISESIDKMTRRNTYGSRLREITKKRYVLRIIKLL